MIAALPVGFQQSERGIQIIRHPRKAGLALEGTAGDLAGVFNQVADRAASARQNVGRSRAGACEPEIGTHQVDSCVAEGRRWR